MTIVPSGSGSSDPCACVALTLSIHRVTNLSCFEGCEVEVELKVRRLDESSFGVHLEICPTSSQKKLNGIGFEYNPARLASGSSIGTARNEGLKTRRASILDATKLTLPQSQNTRCFGFRIPMDFDCYR